MSSRVAVVGVGMIPFTTPRNTESYHVMAEAAARKALDDAGIEYAQVQRGYVGYVYGDSTSGQTALYGLGQTGIPILNVNNNCSTGSSALFLARQAIETGAADCVMALGFEQMMRGALGSIRSDRPSAFTRFDDSTKALQGWDEQAPMAVQLRDATAGPRAVRGRGLRRCRAGERRRRNREVHQQP
ncbi:MAG: hypothetical protein QOF66_6415 [Mycobacterium sp.]|jgi:acetyl-CoA acyltransferase|nr:hypothetical protein [Mycobacterium sp.]